MAINFPNSPSDGQIFYDNTSGNRYVYDAASGLWLSRSNSFYSTVETGQVIFDANDVTGGSNGLYFSTAANTLYANSINVAYDMRVRGNLYIGTNTVTITDSAIMAQTFFIMDNGSPVAVPTGTTSNAAYGVANSAFAHTNTTLTHSQAVYAAVNSAFGVANATFAQVNTLSISANSYAGVMVNSANAYATSTYLPKSGGTVTGTLSVVGDFVVSGNTYQLNANTMSISDPLIYLAANNYSSDIVDIGFIANYVNTGGANVHTGLYREHTDKEYYLFQGYDKEPINNHIGALSNNMTLSVLNADIRTSNLNLGGANAIVWIKSAYDTVNAAYTSSNADFTVSNAAFGQVNTLATSANAYAASVGSSANAFAAATYSTLSQLGQNWAVTNAAFGVANSALPKAGGTMTGKPTISIDDASMAIAGSHLTINSPTLSQASLGFAFGGVGKASIRIDNGGSFVMNSMANTYYYGYDVTGGGATTSNFITGSTQFMSAAGSNVTFPGSARSPIFYDSDNTAYFINAAGTDSYLNHVRTNRLKLDVNYGHSIFGVYSSYRYQGIWSMGESWYLPDDGTTTGNLYGIAWSHPNAGGIAGNLASHGMLILENGTFQGAWGGGRLVTPNDIRGTLFYDYNNTGYYVDPASTTNINAIQLAGALSTSSSITATGTSSNYSYNFGHGNYMRLILPSAANGAGNGDAGLYFWISEPAATWTGAGIARNRRNDGGSFTRINTSLSAQMIRFFEDDSFGFYGTTTGGTEYSHAVMTGGYLYSTGSLRAPIFYDQDNTAYYLNPASTSSIYGIITIGPNPSWSQYLQIGGNGIDGSYAQIATTDGNIHIEPLSGHHLYLNWYRNGNIMVNGPTYFYYGTQYVNGSMNVPIIPTFSVPVGKTKVTYSCTGSNQTFVVPAGVTAIYVKMWGAGGGGGVSGGWGYGSDGGGGGCSIGVIPVTPGETLYLVVGRGGQTNWSNGQTLVYGGGGGLKNNSDNRYAGAGGGYTGIFRTSVTQGNALMIAGGGGGGGSSRAGAGNFGGAGGGLEGQRGGSSYDGKYNYGGGGGTQSAGGTGISQSGGALYGGYGGEPGNGYGAGGGGGYYGGAGGGYSESNTMAGGGGGSGYIGSSVSYGKTFSGFKNRPAMYDDPDLPKSIDGYDNWSNYASGGAYVMTGGQYTSAGGGSGYMVIYY